MESSGSSSTGDYSDGVYDKVEGPSHYAATHKPLPKLKPPMLPTVMLACLILLFVSCFVGILVSGLHFAHRVTSGDCLGQSWVMFSVRPPPPPSHHSPVDHSSQGLVTDRQTKQTPHVHASFQRLANETLTPHRPSWAYCTSHCTCRPPGRANPSTANNPPPKTRFTRPLLSLHASMPSPGLFR